MTGAISGIYRGILGFQVTNKTEFFFKYYLLEFVLLSSFMMSLGVIGIVNSVLQKKKIRQEMRHKNLRQSLWYIKVDILSLRKKGLYWDYGKNVDCFNCVK